MNKTLRILAGLLLSGFCLWISLRNFDIRQLFEILKTARFIWFLPTLLLYLCASFVRAIRWSLLLSPLCKVSAFRIFPILMFGFLVNNILPARAGEFARAYAVHRTMGPPTLAVLGTIAVERFTDLFGLIIMLMIASHVLPADRFPVFNIVFFILIGCMGIVALIVSAKILKKNGTLDHHAWARKIYFFIDQIVSGFSTLRSPFKIANLFFLTVLVWLFEAVAGMVISRIFQLNLNFFQISAFLVGLCMGVMVPASPGYVGTYEYFGKQTLVFMGYSPNLALSFVMTLHLFQILLTVILGLPLLLKLGFSFSKTDKIHQ